MDNSQDNITARETLQKVMPQVAAFLVNSTSVLMVELERDGSVKSANRAVSDCLKIKLPEIKLMGIQDLFTEPDSIQLAGYLSGTEPVPTEEVLLNLVDADQAPHTFRFTIAVFEGICLLMGEPPQGNNLALQEELIQLNNRLSVLSRENIRKGKELAKALADLKEAQTMLVHQEKMASLGQMTAGIAHEINNPLAFVLSNEEVLQRDFSDLLTFINAVGDVLPELASFSPQIHADIIRKAGEAGLEYLAEAVPRKIAANIEGLERVKNIVLDLRNFSRLDEAELKLCDLNANIESTLRFLKPLRQNYGVEFETDFAAMPELLCSPGTLNQAINNIVSNAVQASRPGQKVKIVTRREVDWIVIEVIDSGCGIPVESLGKVFDPFFTTKPVGSGTGLGLSIAHQVVAGQGGRIEVESQPGSGTVFRILLPGYFNT